jgi:hypothetical protein
MYLSSSCFIPGQVVNCFIQSYILFIPRCPPSGLPCISRNRASFYSLVRSGLASSLSVQSSVMYILLSASALVLVEPFLYFTSYSYSSSFSLHLKSRELGSLTLKIQVKGRWSVTIINFLPYRYCLKYLVPQTIGSSSFLW